LTDEEHALLITMHHIVSDEWSMGVFFRELSTLYRAFVRGEDDPLAELQCSMRIMRSGSGSGWKGKY